MKRTAVTLRDPLVRAVEREARRRRVSVSLIAREALVAQVGLGEEPRDLAFVALVERATAARF